MTTLLFPIGHCHGPFYYNGEENGANDQVQQVRQVRLGREIVELSDHEFDVWSMAHGLGGRSTFESGGSWDRDRVVDALDERRVPDAAGIVDRLLGRGLLAEVDVDGPSAADFASRHRLLPLYLGLGNSAETRTMFAAGTLGQPLVGMTRLLYEMWLCGHLAPNLLAACEARAANGHKSVTAAGVDALSDTADPRRLLTQVLTALHALLSPNAACLDLAIPEYAP